MHFRRERKTAPRWGLKTARGPGRPTHLLLADGHGRIVAAPPASIDAHSEAEPDDELAAKPQE